MSKRILCLALSLVLLLGSMTQQVTAMENTSSPEETNTAVEVESTDNGETTDQAPENENNVEQTGPQIFLDGEPIQNACILNHQQTIYASLRSVVQALRPDAAISWEGDHASVTADGLSMIIYPHENYLIANGRYLYLPYGVFQENGVLLLPVRTLAKALDAEVSWDSQINGVQITSGSGAILSGDVYYNADDLYWLSHIIYAESGNQPLSGKISVGNVILNRTNDPIFPDTIYGVIFQKNQFSPVSNGTLYLTPNQESVIAAKLCLDGAVILSDALWFNRAGVTCWASKNRPYITTIGSHAFYA